MVLPVCLTYPKLLNGLDLERSVVRSQECIAKCPQVEAWDQLCLRGESRDALDLIIAPAQNGVVFLRQSNRRA